MAQINILKTSASLVTTPPVGFTAIFVDENAQLKVVNDLDNEVSLVGVGSATASYALTASAVALAATSSYVLSASWVVSASYASTSYTSDYAKTASFISVKTAYSHTANGYTLPQPSNAPTSSYSVSASTYVGTLNNQFNYLFPDKYLSSVHFGRTFIDGNRIMTAGETARWDGYFGNQNGVTTMYLPVLPQNKPTKWTKFYASTFVAYALGSNGWLYSIGDNSTGALGNGTTTTNNDSYILNPVSAFTGSGVTVENFWATQIMVNENSMAEISCFARVNDNGTLKYYGWGKNNNGQLGLGNTTANITSPTEITSFRGSDIAQIATSTLSTYFVSESGTLLACGLNTYGQLATGSTTQYTSPIVCFQTSSTGLAPVTKAAAVNIGLYATDETATYYTTAFMRTKDEKAFGVGFNDGIGYNGTGITSSATYFTPIPSGSTSTQLGSIIDIQGGSTMSGMALDTSGSLWGWGANANGVLNQGNTTSQRYPVVVDRNVKEFWYPRRGRIEQNQVFYNKYVSGSLKTYACGYNGNNGLGVGTSIGNVSSSLSVKFPQSDEYAVQIQPMAQKNNSDGTFIATMFLTNKNRIYVAGRIDRSAGNIHPTVDTLSNIPLQVLDIPF